MNNRLRVALLAGGKSGEREVSLKGAQEVSKALSPEKYDVRRYDPATDIPLLVAEAKDLDVAFILLHGPYGEDGTIQGLLDLLGIPYQGSGVLGSALAMNKDLAKILYRNAGLPVPAWKMVHAAHEPLLEELAKDLGFPMIIKPVSQGSSLGMGLARNADELATALQRAFVYDTSVMVEQYIAGREITGGVLGNDSLIALPIVEIIPGEGYVFFDYEAKYKPGATREICPAPISPELTAKAQDYALRAHRALYLEGYSRTDMIIRNDEIFLLETNTIPGMTPTSLLPQAAQAYGLSFAELLDRLLTLALKKKRV